MTLRTENYAAIFNINIVCEYKPTNFAMEAQSREMEDAREKKWRNYRLGEFKGKPRKRPSGTKMLKKDDERAWDARNEPHMTTQIEALS